MDFFLSLYLWILLDMRVANGEIDVDQSPLTGESLLISKSAEEKHRDVLAAIVTMIIAPSICHLCFLFDRSLVGRL